MRAQVFLFKASCYLFPVFFLCCFAANRATGQQSMARNFPHQPVFIEGIYMVHQKSAVTANMVSVTAKPPVKFAAPTAAADKITDEKIIGSIIKKNELVAKNANTIAPVDPETTEIKDIAAHNGGADLLLIKDNKAADASEAEQASNETSAATFDDELDPLITKYAEMISVDPVDMNNFPLYRFIDEWYGTEYLYGGMDTNGIDCSAFSQKLYGTVYAHDLLRTVKQQRRTSERIRNSDDANEGDLIFFRIHHIRVSHVGVYLANGYFVHASRSHGVMISSLNDRYWRSRYAGCGRVAREEKTGVESDFQ